MRKTDRGCRRGILPSQAHRVGFSDATSSLVSPLHMLAKRRKSERLVPRNQVIQLVAGSSVDVILMVIPRLRIKG